MLKTICVLLCYNFIACSSHDLGRPCPELTTSGTIGQIDGNRALTQEIVEQNLSFPCESLICVATTGKTGYCSKKCTHDGSCPDGFECRTIQEVGPFKNDMFCAWKSCAKNKECGDSKMRCSKTDNADPQGQLKLCGYKEDSQCI